MKKVNKKLIQQIKNRQQKHKIQQIYQKDAKNPKKASKTIKNREIQKFKLNLNTNLLTKKEKAIIIPVQFDWNASKRK